MAMPDASMVRILLMPSSLEDAVELLADLVQQVYVQLVVQKAVDLQDVAGTNLAFLHNTFLPKVFICDDALSQTQFHSIMTNYGGFCKPFIPKKSY